MKYLYVYFDLYASTGQIAQGKREWWINDDKIYQE